MASTTLMPMMIAAHFGWVVKSSRRQTRCFLPDCSATSVRCLGIGSRVAEQDGQKDQICEDKDNYADAGGDREIPDDLNTDQHQHCKAYGVGQQSGQPR